ncbi:hypothetical protein BDA99DRAFT_537544 [Phascolomyces articulosus]|uniref:Uncharacterized protein n=1 Tax=Phascolomyces articulosus TaxID=60185 RepID=A0AAD5JZU3_9FUNG|nr:hypothetical protein BDA99DRAFT_537544 [Phascolomyces articulosus]
MVRALLFLVVAYVTILHQYYVHAYCFYNKMSDKTEVSIIQIDGQKNTSNMSHRHFRHMNMPPGSKECCPYTSDQCSKEKHKMPVVNFGMSYFFFDIIGKRKDPNDRMDRRAVKTVVALCGGYITATGGFDSFSYQIYAANHTQVGSVS